MKLFTASGVATLFSILAPVTAVSVPNSGRGITVPNPDRNFSFLCENGRSYAKDYLIGKVEEAINILRDPDTHYDFPVQLNHLNYHILGPLWYYPVNLPAPSDFVVFNTNSRIAGVATYVDLPYGEMTFRACSLN
ncbi:putative candidate secreted effector protein [Blumeria hordei DH14]|uniref:Putative candidate secreted effector protein n=1 Tax=Blumeria graminis f. sp. hordei (strain DH14) TaxID=546991 RepID=N1J908_BLUG1|nr:putative candidate secreted effector protein [Blumeria hordei DH14]